MRWMHTCSCMCVAYVLCYVVQCCVAYVKLMCCFSTAYLQQPEEDEGEEVDDQPDVERVFARVVVFPVDQH